MAKEELQNEETSKAEKFSAEDVKRAKAILKTHGVEAVYLNSRGEIFTQKCNALNSEKGDKTKVKTYK